MKGKLSDLHEHLFDQLERLNNKELKGDQLKEEICRAEAINKIAGQLISNGNLALRAATAGKEAKSDPSLRLLLE